MHVTTDSLLFSYRFRPLLLRLAAGFTVDCLKISIQAFYVRRLARYLRLCRDAFLGDFSTSLSEVVKPLHTADGARKKPSFLYARKELTFDRPLAPTPP
jgi:hypothetical protein